MLEYAISLLLSFILVSHLFPFIQLQTDIFCLADIPTAKSLSEELFKVKRGGEQEGKNYTFTENCRLCCQKFLNNSQ